MPEGDKKKQLKTIQFGEHITIDGYGGDYESLNSKETILFLLSDLTEKLGMKMLSGPMVVSAPGNWAKDPGGWSGVVIIAESHVSVHTFPKRRFVSADVYSCKNGLDVQKIVAYFTKTFKLSDVETHFIRRGTRYPAENLV
ncbi:adenosylmethionine decarboxylase [Candidatus Nomurabacteria bacterium]|nr:adenosylmethionine decarboxylase [Candidatus Nomurabacteria bacterium]